MIISGVMIMHYQPIKAFVTSQMKMSPNSLLFKLFQHPPIEVTLGIYVFNVTNPEQFLAGKEKLKLEEVGPYVYIEDIKNTNPIFHDNGTLSFTTKRFLEFRRDLSVGDPLKDTIISPNIPLLGISSFLKDKSMMTNLIVAQIANIMNSQQFLNLTIDQYLWGYDDNLVTLAHNALPNWINFPRFGIFDRLLALDNASNTVTIKITDDPIESSLLSDLESRAPYSIVNFNGSPGLHHWGYHDQPRNETSEYNSRCNSIEGAYESGVFDARFINESTDIWFYRRAFCRAVPIQYSGRGRYENFDTVNARIRSNFLSLPEQNPQNECYCKQPGVNCRYNGVGYLAPCYYGIPITISQPHFYNADAALLEQVEGMHPDRTKHDTHLAISETIGVPVHARMRIQINLDVDTRMSSRCKPFNGIMLPLFWIELGTYQLSWIFYAADYGIKYVVPIFSGLLSWLLIIFGAAIAASAALLTFYSQPHPGFEDLYDNKVGYTPIRVIPVYTNPTIRIS